MNNGRNLTLLTDMYELTMMQGYFKNAHANVDVIFDMFYRRNPDGNGFSICCGLEQVIDYVENLRFNKDDIDYLSSLGIFDGDFLDYLADFRFTGDIYAIPEGRVMFPKEPIVKVKAPIMQAQLLETAILNIINHQSLIATKAARVVHAAEGDGVMEFGLRRAQGPDAGIYGARAAVIAGCIGTSNVLAGKMFGVPVLGTHAHSWIMSFPDELTAFRSWRDSQKTQEERMEALTGERDAISGQLTQAEAERDELRRELYVLKKGVTGEAAEFVAFKAAKLVSDKVSFEQAVDSILEQSGVEDPRSEFARGGTPPGFDWTARVGGGSTKTDPNSVMNALIRNARK